MGAWRTAATTLQVRWAFFNDAAEFNEAIKATNVEAHVPVTYRSTSTGERRGLQRRQFCASRSTDQRQGDLATATSSSRCMPTRLEATTRSSFQMGRAHQDSGHNKEPAADLYKRYLACGCRATKTTACRGSMLLARRATQAQGRRREGRRRVTRAGDAHGQAAQGLARPPRKVCRSASALQAEASASSPSSSRSRSRVTSSSSPSASRRRSDLLKQAAQVFLDVVSFGVAEWTTAALYQVGHTFENFGKALRGRRRRLLRSQERSRRRKTRSPRSEDLRRAVRGEGARRLRQRLEESDRSRHLQPVDGEDAANGAAQAT